MCALGERRVPQWCWTPLISVATILPICGCYASFMPAEALARIFGTGEPAAEPGAILERRTPTSDCVVVRYHPETGARHLDLLKWGLLPYWTKESTKG
jgi:putative SOS response-associated peptidase YedK